LAGFAFAKPDLLVACFKPPRDGSEATNIPVLPAAGIVEPKPKPEVVKPPETDPPQIKPPYPPPGDVPQEDRRGIRRGIEFDFNLGARAGCVSIPQCQTTWRILAK